MATLPTNVRNAACNAIVDLVDAGAGAGYVMFHTAAHAEVAKCVMTDPAFGNSGASNAGEAIAAAIADDTTAAGGVCAHVHLFDSTDAEVMSCTIATSGAEFTIPSLTVAVGAIIGVSALTFTVPA